MAIPVFDKFKSVTAEGKLLDYDEIADIPIIRKDLSTGGNSTGYYLHIGATSTNFTNGAIYFYSESKNKYYIIDGGAENPVEYASVQALEDGRYNIPYVKLENNEATRIYSSNSIALETKGNFATRVYNSNNQLAGSISISTNGESVNIKGMSVGITADFGLVSLTSGDGVSLDLSDVAEFSSAVYAPSFIEGNEALSAKYASKTDVQHHIDFFKALSGGVYDLSAYKFATKSELSNYVDGQALQEARYDLSAYKFISSDKLKGLDTYSEDTFDINAGSNGVYWKNTVAYLDKDNDIITQGTYYGLAPIVAGDNVTFTVDEAHQVVKISANLSNHATKTYVDNAVSALVDSSPETLNTLNELAAALGDDPNFATTVSTEIGKKQNTITGAATTITSSNLTASRALVSDANGKVAVSAVTSTELGYLDGVTSAIQTQLNGTVKLAGAQTITGDKTTTGLFKIQNGAASGAFVLGADVNAKTLTANQRKLGRMGVPSYDSTTKTMAGISFDSQQYANYADFGGHPNNAASIAPDVIRFTVANSHTNAINGARSLALQISKQAGLSDTSGGGTSVVGAKFFVPVIVDGSLSATSLTENGTALSDKYLGKTAKASSATVADSANAVAWSKVTGKPTFATVATSGSYNDLSNKPTIPAAVSVTQKLTSGTEIGSVKIGSTTTKLYAPTATSVDLSGYLPLSGGTIKGNILFSNSNAQGSQPNLKWKTINSKTPYVGYCTASTDGTFLVASLGGTSYTTGLSIGGSSGNLLWKGTRVATTADIPSLSNYSTLANTIKSLSISGKTITYTKGDGTTGTLTTQDTVYSLPTAGKDTLGGVKTTSTVTSASGYTACPIIGGVPYYKDTDGQLRQYYTHANMDVELPIIYSYNTTVSGTGDYKTTYGGVKAGFTFNPYTDTLRVGNINLTGDNLYMGAVAVAKGDDWVDFMLNGGDAGIYFANDENGGPTVELYGNVTVNGNPIGSGGGGSSGGWRQVTFDEFKTICDNGTIVRLVPTPDGDSNYESVDTKFKNLGLQIVCGDGGCFCVINTELDPYTTDATQLCFRTYEILREEQDYIYASVYDTISYGSAASNEHREHVYELDDSNCEFYIWEG